MKYPRLTLLCIVLGTVASISLIHYFFAEERHFENLALGTQTQVYQARDKGKFIHIQKLSNDEEPMLLDGLDQRRVMLFLGNSQTHSINQLKEGQVNFVELLNRQWNSDSLTVRAQTLPNANIQEFYLCYQYWKQKLNLKYLVVPVFMDDMREEGIRSVYFPKLVDEKFQLKDTSDETSKVVNGFLRNSWTTASANTNATAGSKVDPEMAALQETVQEKTETYLNHKLDSNWSTWHNRQNVRGEFDNFMYKFRNSVFQINASTVRRMMPQIYKRELQALTDLAASCAKDGVKMLIYIPPIRSDLKLPYDDKEYAQCKREVQAIADSHPGMVSYQVYDTIVPGSLWGYKEATSLNSKPEIDFMHFQFKGHQILAEALQSSLTKIIGH